MADLKAVIGAVVDVMRFPMKIWGFTLSFWGIMLTLIAGGIIIWLIVRFFDE